MNQKRPLLNLSIIFEQCNKLQNQTFSTVNKHHRLVSLKACANAHNIVGQQDITLLGPTCCEHLHTMLCVVACCCDLLEVAGGSLKLVKFQSQQVPTFLLFPITVTPSRSIFSLLIDWTIEGTIISCWNTAANLSRFSSVKMSSIFSHSTKQYMECFLNIWWRS